MLGIYCNFASVLIKRYDEFKTRNRQQAKRQPYHDGGNSILDAHHL